MEDLIPKNENWTKTMITCELNKNSNKENFRTKITLEATTKLSYVVSKRK